MQRSLVSLGIVIAAGLSHVGCYRSIVSPTAPQDPNQPPVVDSAQPLVYENQWGSKGTAQGQFEYIPAVASDSQGNVYVGGNTPDCIQKFDGSGKFLMEWGNSGSGNAKLNGLVSLCVDSSDNVYAYENGDNQIKKFTSNGAYITQWNGSGPQSTGAIRAIACGGPSNNIYSVDAIYQKICKFDGSGTFVTSWSTQGSWDTTTSDPDGIACDQWGSVYTPDYYNSCVYKYSNTGTFQCQIGGPGSGPGKFGVLSCGICVGKNGIVYISDYAYGVVDEFNLQGKYLCQWGNTVPHALGNFDFFCLSPSGKAYVAYNDSIWIFQP